MVYCRLACMGDSSTLFAYSFLLLFTRSSRIPCIFFLKGHSRAFILEKEILPFLMWFQRSDFLMDPPLHFKGG